MKGCLPTSYSHLIDLNLKYLFSLVLLGVAYQQACGQAVQLAFDRQNNFTYATRLNIRHSLTQGPYELQVALQHRNLLNTNITRNPFVQAYLTTRIWQFYRFTSSSPFSAASWLESDQFWTGQNLRYNIYGGLRFQPSQALSIIPLIGYSWDKRRITWDQGWSPALRIAYRYRWPEGIQMETQIWGRIRFISPRRQHNLAVRSNWLSEVSEEASLGIGVEVGSNQIDDYKSQSIERIQSDTVGGYVALRYDLTSHLLWESDTRIRQSRRIFAYRPFGPSKTEFNNQRFNQFDLYSTQRISWNQDKWSGLLIHTFERLNRGYQIENSLEAPAQLFARLEEREQQKDFSRQANSFELLIQRPIKQRHQLAISANNQYIQYDTPAEDNFDDHDELTYGLRLRWTGAWSRRFQTQYSIWGGVRQYAFLFEERSQDNYTQRNLRLDFQYDWQPTNFLSIQGEQSIYVTYNVKDFTDRNLTDRSTRNLESRLRIMGQIRPRWRLEAQLYRKEVHLSYLNWDRFAETPLDTTTIYRLDLDNYLSLKKKWLQRRWRLSAGYRHFTQLRFLNTSMINLSNLLTPINLRIRSHQTGPTLGARMNGRRGTELDLTVWWQWQIQDFKFKAAEQFTTLSASYREDRLQEVEQAFRPFIKLRVGVWL